MQRSVSTRSRAIRTSAHPVGGTSSAGVGQACAQGISSHITQAVVATCSTGVPAASPAEGGRYAMACTGQAPTHSPHRVQAATKAASGSAPGGRICRTGATRSLTWPTTSRRARLSPCVKKPRRSILPLPSSVIA